MEKYSDFRLIDLGLIKRGHPDTLAVDFDGVIARYRGGYDKEELGELLPGARESLQILADEGWRILINSCRDRESIREFLEEHGIHYDAINEDVPEGNRDSSKPYAKVYLDDRALKFEGAWDSDLLDQLREFKTYWE